VSPCPKARSWQRLRRGSKPSAPTGRYARTAGRWRPRRLPPPSLRR
jgi:hypothetical protein